MDDRLNARSVRMISGSEGAPTLILTMDMDEADDIAERIWDLHWNLMIVENARWGDDLTPWPAKSIFRGQPDFGGRAEDYLAYIKDILPEGNDAPIFIAGYSLAGLFACWAAVRDDAFAGFASASGSMWYPGFADFIEGIHPKAGYAYFSVGDREAHGRNPAFRSIEPDTERVRAHLAACGAQTIFEMNPGGHFQDADLRLARGIRWLAAAYQADHGGSAEAISR